MHATPPPFDIVISNVPGVREPLYWNGARLDGNYPMSIALDGRALNIPQRLLGHLESSLKDLERAVGV